MLKFDFLQFLYLNDEKFSNLKMVHGIHSTKKEKKRKIGLPIASLLQRLRNHDSMPCQVDTRHSEGSFDFTHVS